jgi:hypothetical protein
LYQRVMILASIDAREMGKKARNYHQELKSKNSDVSIYA